MLEKVGADIEVAIPGCRLEIISNGSPSGQHSLLIATEHALEVARFLRDKVRRWRLDYCSNVTRVWTGWTRRRSEKVKVKKIVEGVEQEIEEVKKTQVSGYLETVYHLYSMEKKHGRTVVIRMRTVNRTDQVHICSRWCRCGGARSFRSARC